MGGNDAIGHDDFPPFPPVYPHATPPAMLVRHLQANDDTDYDDDGSEHPLPPACA